MQDFRSFRIHMSEDKSISAGFEQLSVDDLTEGDVVIKVSHSTINYKDALAATGKGRILRKYPLNGGIDLAGNSCPISGFSFQGRGFGLGCWLRLIRSARWRLFRIRAPAWRLCGTDAFWTERISSDGIWNCRIYCGNRRY